MAKGVNKVFILGNVGKDPEIRSTQSGMTIANFTVATADRQKDAQGNWQDKTEWHNMAVSGRRERPSASRWIFCRRLFPLRECV